MSIDNILDKIGVYFGITSRHAFTSMLVKGAAGTNALQAPNTPTAEDIDSKIAEQLLSISEGGLTTPQLVALINQKLRGASPEDLAKFRSAIRICYEPDLPDDAGVVLIKNKQQSFSIVGPQGVGEDSAYSMRHICGMNDDLITVNNPSAAPRQNGTSLSVIQVFKNRLSPANRDLGALTFFMNSIPTIEISRAVPFIDIVLIQQGNHLNADNRISRLSLGQFLLGNTKVTNQIEQQYLSANDAEVSAYNDAIPEFEPNTRTAGGTGQSAPIPISTAGMELFTSPQTLVPANEVYREADQINMSQNSALTGADNTQSEVNRGVVESTLARSAPVLDRFRPLMSLKSVNFSVAPAGGMMCYKSGNIKLMLHDRSRLAEVSAFVRPALYGTTHLQIEYGWAHPASKIHDARDAGIAGEGDNLIGQFIGALRVKEKYQVVNSSFQFDESGQVDIDMSIAMLSAATTQQTNISFGIETTSEYKRLEELSKMIRAVRERLDENTAAGITGDQDVLGALSNPTSLFSLDKDTVNAIVNLSQNSLITQSQSPAIQDLGVALRAFVGTPKGNNKNRRLGAEGQIEKARASIKEIVAEMITSLNDGQDPFFLRSAAPVGGESAIINSPTTYVSLGKVISKFVGSKIAQTGKYKDVQFVFYNFNDRASYMSNRNIASFPIKISTLSTIMSNAIDRLFDLNVAKFMTIMSQYFLHDPGTEAYGFSNLYTTPSPENEYSRQLSERYTGNPGGRAVDLSEDSAAVIQAQERILRTAYRSMSEGNVSPAGEVTFKMPTIQALVETVPVGTTATQSGGSPAPETILRVHIFDSQATSYATLQAFLEASSDKSINTLNAAAQAAIAACTEVKSTAASESNTSDGSDYGYAKTDFATQLLAAQNAGLIEPWPPQERVRSSADPLRPESSQRYRMKGGFPALKDFISRTMPSMRYGEGASGVLKASISSMNDPALSSVNMLRQAKSPDTPTGHRAQGLPLQVAPVECNLETIGCPLWNFGQQVFIDFGTGTTVDAIYGVCGVEHSISAGEFTTSVKLTPLNSYAKYISAFDQLENVITAIEGIEARRSQSG